VEVGPGVRYCPASKELHTPEGPLSLSQKEHILLELLIRSRGRVVTKEQIERLLYQDEIMSEAALKNLVHRLRKKVGKGTIVNVHGTGFILR